MILRTEETKDYQDVYTLNYKAFGGRDDESRLIERIRSSEFFVPELSIVAELDGKIAGHILFSKANVIDDEKNHEVIVLAPVAVEPGLQRKGIGSKLIQEGLYRCKGLGYGVVLLIGHPEYYLKFGFKPARQFEFELRQFEVPDDVFMVCEIYEGVLRSTKGELIYPEAFITG
ncbi:GNAT family N-acetyltransferase [Paenibacillus sp. 1P07SE]|uniref:GNAT family N-acetyltransferase n=1 Tax=Paenibacillus sp. 1P07SE TaxID=3132209 RepID=UPI0039A6C04C